MKRRHIGRVTSIEHLWHDAEGQPGCPECNGSGKISVPVTINLRSGPVERTIYDTCPTCLGYRYALDGAARKYLDQVQKPTNMGGAGEPG